MFHGISRYFRDTWIGCICQKYSASHRIKTILPKFRQFKEITGWGARKTSVYVLTNFDTTFEQDLERIYTLRDLGYDPYVMIYDKEHTKGNDPVRLLQRYVNNRRIFRTISRFEDYDPKKG